MREARGRVFKTRFRASNHARDAPRSLRSKFGKIENFRFRNFGSEIWAAFALPALAVFRGCPLVVPSDFCRIYPEISVFDFHRSGKRTRRTRGGPGASPVGLCRHNTHCTNRNLKNHEKSPKIIKIHQKSPKCSKTEIPVI